MSRVLSTASVVCPHLIRITDGVPSLLGSQCNNCQEVYFPDAANCTRCLSTELVPYDLGSTGILWTWTIQSFLPKAPYNSGETPETFKPYGVGYVQMASGIKVESRLTVADPEALQIGMPVELCLVPYRHMGQDDEQYTFAFTPASRSEGDA